MLIVILYNKDKIRVHLVKNGVHKLVSYSVCFSWSRNIMASVVGVGRKMDRQIEKKKQNYWPFD